MNSLTTVDILVLSVLACVIFVPLGSWLGEKIGGLLVRLGDAWERRRGR